MGVLAEEDLRDRVTVLGVVERGGRCLRVPLCCFMECVLVEDSVRRGHSDPQALLFADLDSGEREKVVLRSPCMHEGEVRGPEFVGLVP